MELLDALLPFIIMIIYFLASARKRGKKGRKSGTPQPVPSTTEQEKQGRPNRFQDLLRQIQEAAEEAQQAQRPQPAEEPNHWESGTPNFEEDATYALGGTQDFDHDEHGFGTDNPFSEEAFEAAPRNPTPPQHAPGHLDYNPHKTGLGTLDKPAHRKRARRHPKVATLMSPRGLRDAFVLKQILDEPLSKRR